MAKWIPYVLALTLAGNLAVFALGCKRTGHQIDYRNPKVEDIPTLVEQTQGTPGGFYSAPGYGLEKACELPGGSEALIRLLEDDDWDVRLNVVNTLGHLEGRGTIATDLVITELIEALEDEVPGVRWAACTELGDLLRTDVRYHKTSREGPFEPEMVRAVDAIGKLLEDNQLTIRLETVRAFAGISMYSDMAVPNLVPALEDDDPVVRVRAAEALSFTSADVPEAVVVLLECASDESRFYSAGVGDLGFRQPTSRGTIEALARFGRVAINAIPFLTEALDSDDPEIRLEAAIAIANIDPDNADDAIPVLIESLESGSYYHDYKAAEALGIIGPSAREALPILFRCLSDPGPRFTLRQAAAEAIVRIEGGSYEVLVPSLIELLGHENPNVRGDAAMALGRIGTPGIEGLAALREMLVDEQDQWVRRRAERAIERLEGLVEENALPEKAAD